MAQGITLKLGARTRSVKVDQEIQDSIFGLLDKVKKCEPLYYQDPEEWFYPSGTIVLVEKAEVMEFQMDGTTVFKFPSSTTEIELHFKTEGKS